MSHAPGNKEEKNKTNWSWLVVLCKKLLKLVTSYGILKWEG